MPNRSQEKIDTHGARRLALASAGLLKPEWTEFPTLQIGSNEAKARQAAYEVIHHFGYLQLDTVSIAGARSHAIVLLSRLEGFDPLLAERLLQPGAPLFEYWGHEVSWIPIHLYPVFAFRRRDYRRHPWWGDLIGEHPKVVADLRRRIRKQGPLRSAEMEGQRNGKGWWELKIAKRVASALWSNGELAIRERHHFQQVYDLRERVIAEQWYRQDIAEPVAVEQLLLLALQGHGWASTTTLMQTWRLQDRTAEVRAALQRLVEKQQILPCSLTDKDGKSIPGWIRPEHLALTDRLKRVRPRQDKGVLLSPFDPVLWDRRRVDLLFGFHQILEIFKPAGKRMYGYYCLPVLAGERLIARVDLKAERKRGLLHVLSLRYEDRSGKRSSAEDRQAVSSALRRYADALHLKTDTDLK